MSDSVITITVTGRDAAAARVNCLIRDLTSRRPLHAQIATDAVTETGKRLQQLNRHNTATRLGAEPTNFRDRNALSLQPVRTMTRHTCSFRATPDSAARSTTC